MRYTYVGLFFDLRGDWKTPQDGFAAFKSFCLDVALDLGQTGSPVTLLGATAPEHNEGLPERKYFTTSHYLAIVCEDDELERRLRARSWWNPDITPFDVEYNRWLRIDGKNLTPPVTVVNTPERTPDEAADAVLRWLGSA